MTDTSTATTFDRDDPPILGANPFVGLTREQVAAALARLAQRVAVEPGAAVAARVDGNHDQCFSGDDAGMRSGGGKYHER